MRHALRQCDGIRGSVIPLFVAQLKEGKELTITDPKMTRFLMSLEDSVDLVLYAFEHAHQGDLFVQKAPASTVADLACTQELFGKDNDVNIIGTRHGEKHESLISREEMAKAEDRATTIVFQWTIGILIMPNISVRERRRSLT